MPADNHQVYLAILLMKRRRIIEGAVIQLETSVHQRILVSLQLLFFFLPSSLPIFEGCLYVCFHYHLLPGLDGIFLSKKESALLQSYNDKLRTEKRLNSALSPCLSFVAEGAG